MCRHTPARFAGMIRRHLNERDQSVSPFLTTPKGNIALLITENEIAHAAVDKKAITALEILNEAFSYARPSSFSRGLRIDIGNFALLLISGTASIDETGTSIHIGDFRAQCRRTFLNITKLLEAEGATWKDIVRTTCYLRDIERDYEAFNEERTGFYREQGLDPLPASTGIQAILCRPELLIEIEAIALFQRKPAK